MWCDGVTMYILANRVVNRTCSQSRQVSSYDNGMSYPLYIIYCTLVVSLKLYQINLGTSEHISCTRLYYKNVQLDIQIP